jgi:hypothetical protein
MTRQRPPTRSIALIVAVVVLALGLTGIALPRLVSPAEPTPDTHVRLSDAALDLVVRGDVYHREERILRRAEDDLAGRCMTARGWDYDVVEQVAEPPDDEWRPDLARRRADGYGLANQGPAPEEGADAIAPSRRAAYASDLLGSPEQRVGVSLASGRQFWLSRTGCLADARTWLFGNLVTAGRVMYAPQDARMAVFRHIEQEPEVRRQLESWASCMRERGHPFPSPQRARRAAAALYRAKVSATARRLEVAIAVADAQCALRTGLPTAIERASVRLTHALPVHQRRELNLVAARRADALRRAVDLQVRPVR